MQKLAYIQQWRGGAILLVILAHTSHHDVSIDFGVPFIDNFIWFGGHGVTLFFVLSAYTILYSQAKEPTGKFDKLGFLIKRFFRIAPLYYLGLLFYRMVVDKNYAFDTNFFLNLTFITWPSPSAVQFGVPGGWSITTEFTFYYILPFIYFYIVQQKNTLRWLLLGIIISRVLIVVYSRIYPGLEPYYYLLNPLTQFPVFLVGIMLFNIIENKEAIYYKQVDLILIAIILILEYALIKSVIRDVVPVAILFSIVIYLNSICKVNVSFFNKLLGFIGELSFTIYISHFAVARYLKLNYIDFYDNSISAFCLRFFGTLALSIIISLPLYYLIEKPFIILGRKINNRRRRIYEN